MPYKILEQYGVAKSTTYHPHDHIFSVYATLEELLEFVEISGTPIS